MDFKITKILAALFAIAWLSHAIADGKKLQIAESLKALRSNSESVLTQDQIQSFKNIVENSHALDIDRLDSSSIDTIGQLAERTDADEAFQQKVLELLSLRIGIDVDPHGFAYLTDRIEQSHGREQLLGSIPVVDDGHVTRSRVSVDVEGQRDLDGLEPLSEWERELQLKLTHKKPTKDFLQPTLAMVHPVYPTAPALRAELLNLQLEDQAPREKFNRAEMARIDADNLPRIKKIINDYGFPTAHQVGRSGVQAAFLLIQHAASDPIFMQHCLDLMQPSVEDHDLPLPMYALLVDRVRLQSGLKQLYGTQMVSDPSGGHLAAIEDPAHVNARRERMHMSPLPDDLLRK